MVQRINCIRKQWSWNVVAVGQHFLKQRVLCLIGSKILQNRKMTINAALSLDVTRCHLVFDGDRETSSGDSLANIGQCAAKLSRCGRRSRSWIWFEVGFDHLEVSETKFSIPAHEIGLWCRYFYPRLIRHAGDWNLQDWKMTDNIAGVEIAGLDNDRLEFDGLENDELHQYGLTLRRLEYIMLTASVLL